MIVLVSGATTYPRDASVGHLIVPGQWNDPKSLDLQPGCWAMDNGAFGGAFDPGAFVSMLDAYHGYQGSHCRFVTAPDVIYKSRIGDAAATLAKWPFWSRLIRGLGWAPAFVVQDGLTADRIPWDELGALFIGGSTAFKESATVRSFCGMAKARGIWVHWGRVNGKRRYELAQLAGADSFDGTGFSMHPNVNIPKVAEWETALQQQGRML